jgi:DUF4097 and DUF4098 domain-containing protein YvlB
MRTVLSLLTLSALGASVSGVAQAQPTAQQVTVPFSDPSRQGTLRINLLQGGVTIRGTNRKDVLIEARSSEETRRRERFWRGRGDNDSTGLQRLTQAGRFVVEENNNQVVVASGAMHRGTDFTIQVPTRTHLKLSALNGGAIMVENVEGEIEVNNQNASITLTNVAGSVVANAMNGTVKVIMTRLTVDKAMAFTSFNGDVDVTLPATAKANLKMRSDRGEIFTDFDVQMRPTTPAASQRTRRSDGRIRIDVNQSIQGSVNGGGPEFELRTFNGNIYVRKGTP